MELFQKIISFFSFFISKNCRENTQFEVLFYLGEPVNKWSLTHRQRRMEGGIRLPKVDSDTSFCRSLQCRYCYVKLLEKEIIFGQKVFIVEKKKCLIYCSIQEKQRINGRLHTETAQNRRRDRIAYSGLRFQLLPSGDYFRSKSICCRENTLSNILFHS